MSYRQFLGTKESPATAGLFEAITAGKVVADHSGCWVEVDPRKRSQRAIGFDALPAEPRIRPMRQTLAASLASLDGEAA